MSSSAVDGYARVSVIDESRAGAQRLAAAYGNSNIAAEAIVRQTADRGMAWTIVRPPAVIGPGSVIVHETIRLLTRGMIHIDTAGPTPA